MTGCDRFEREGLQQLEQGLQLDAHFDSCPDCLEFRRVHARLGQAIADLDVGVEPSASWKAGVWGRINQQSDSGAFRRWADVVAAPLGGWQWTRWLAPAGAITVLALFWIWLARPPAPVSLSAQVYGGQAAVLRGQDAHPGDELRVRATIAKHAHAALRVYFNDTELIADCSSDTSCNRDGDTISVVAGLKSLGTYRPVLIVSDKAIPPPRGNLEQDAGDALRAGALVQAGDPIPVR